MINGFLICMALATIAAFLLVFACGLCSMNDRGDQ